MLKSCVHRKVGNMRVAGGEDEIAEFVEDMLKELAIMVGMYPMSEERQATIKKRVAQFEDNLAQRQT